MRLFRKASNNTFRTPENFSVFEEFKRDKIQVWAGGNDWEAGITAASVRTKPSYHGEMEQVWFTLSVPQGMCKDNVGRKEDKEWNEYASSVVKKWVKAAKKIQKEEGRYSICLDCFNEALTSEEMKDCVDEFGWDRTKWEELDG